MLNFELSMHKKTHETCGSWSFRERMDKIGSDLYNHPSLFPTTRTGDDYIYRRGNYGQVSPVAGAGSNKSRQDSEIASAAIDKPRRYWLLHQTIAHTSSISINQSGIA